MRGRSLVLYRVGAEESLQGSKKFSPVCFLEAYCAVYEELNRRGIYEEVEEGFLNVLLSGCAHNLRTVTEWDIRRYICQRMNEPEFMKTGLMERKAEYFRKPEDFIFVKGLLNAADWEKHHRKNLLPTEVETVQKAESENPKVSVIIPVYNVEKYIRECLDSIVGQTLKDIEIICVNDGSADSSLEILKEYGERDKRITIISQENRGISSARNHEEEKASANMFTSWTETIFWKKRLFSSCIRLHQRKLLMWFTLMEKAFLRQKNERRKEELYCVL